MLELFWIIAQCEVHRRDSNPPTSHRTQNCKQSDSRLLFVSTGLLTAENIWPHHTYCVLNLTIGLVLHQLILTNEGTASRKTLYNSKPTETNCCDLSDTFMQMRHRLDILRIFATQQHRSRVIMVQTYSRKHSHTAFQMFHCITSCLGFHFPVCS